MRRGLLLLVLYVATAACSESGKTCDHHWDCPVGQVCDEGACIPDDGRARACELDEHCWPNERCREGVCSTSPACTSDEDCPEGSRCHVLSGDCIPVETSCASDEDCPPGNFCDPGTGVCLPSGCQTDEDCPPGQVCNPATGTCGAAGPECTTDADCVAGERCDTVAGVCRTGGCINDADCELGEHCDHASGVCRPIGQDCQNDADCPAGYACDPESGNCEPEVECSSDTDCPDGSWCDTDSGRCSTDCRSDADCSAGYACNTATGDCEQVPECTNDDDCDPGEMCLDGSCVPIQGDAPDGAPCASNEDCESRNCVPITEPPVCLRPCRSSAGCPADWTCVEVTSAWYCIHEDLLSELLGLNIDVGAGEYGAYCTGDPVYNPYCHSMICNQNLNACTTDCTTDADCPYGTICRVNFETGIMRAYCFENPGLDPVGAYCDTDYYCSFNVCLGSAWMCSTGCCSSGDCPAGWACGRMQSNDPQAPGYAKGCFPREWAGSLSAGASCSSDDQCRSHLCLEGTCSDFCCTDADCPHPMRCTLFVDVNDLAVTLCAE